MQNLLRFVHELPMPAYLVLFAVISVAFTRNTYTVVEGGEVEACVETSGSLERPYLQLSLQTSTRS